MSPEHQSLLEKVQTVLTNRFHEAISVTVTAEIPGNFLVLRCQLAPVPHGLSSTVIIKQTPMADKSTRNRVLNEIACLEFLSNLESPHKFAPILYAYDEHEGIVVLEDLGERPSLMDLLRGDNWATAEAGLLAYGRFFAQLHAATQHKEAQFHSIQHRLGTASPFSDSNIDLTNYQETIQQLLEAISLTNQIDFWHEFTQMVEAITATPYRTFIHCDSGPQNLLVLDDGVRLLDYEFGSYGHAFLDVAGWRNGFQQSGQGLRVPPGMITAVETTYRTELMQAIPDLAQDSAFYDATVYANAHWLIGRLAHFWRGYLQNRLEQGPGYDEQWLSEPDKAKHFHRFQQQGMLTLIHTFIETSLELNRLPAMRQVAQKTVALLQNIWPHAEQLPIFPLWSRS